MVEDLGESAHQARILDEGYSARAPSLGSAKAARMMKSEARVYSRLAQLEWAFMTKVICCQPFGSWIALGATLARGYKHCPAFPA